MSKFHNLKVAEVKRETEESVSILFDIPSELTETFDFVQGQYITIRTQIEGEEVRRSYSICSCPYGKELRVAVKQIPNGKFSTYANTTLKVGDELDVMPPLGSFYTTINEQNEKNYAAFASGSGITPIMSIIRATLKAEPKSTFNLFYGNRTKETIIFNSDLEDLQKDYPNRLHVYHVLSRDSDVEHKFRGRLSAEKCREYHNDLLDLTTLDEVFLCGPEEMIFEIKDALTEIGVSESNIHFELFTTAKAAKSEDDTPKTGGTHSQVEVIVDGESYEFELDENGETILDAAMAVDADVPFACKGGVCCACKCKVIEGSVTMEVNYALDEEEVEEGFVLACQSHPTSAKVVVDFDEI
jgi:ring-1,2-phenylacetyl-CoA epoxidase subunit PaaE